MSERRVLVWWFVISLCLAGFISPYASRLPDGLERVARDLRFIDAEKTVRYSPAPDYSWKGTVLEKLPTFLAGILGTVIVFATAVLLAKALSAATSKREKQG